MFRLGITAPGSRFDCSTAEGIERAADLGYDGIEFYHLEDADGEAIRAAGEEHGVEVFGTLAVGGGSNIDDYDAPAMVRPDDHETVVADVERSVEEAAGLGCSTLVVTVGPDQPDLERAVQHNAIVRALRAVAPAAEEAGITVVVEPLNVRVDHPGYYLTTVGEGVELVEAVDSPNVKLLFDVYHQQITEGDVIRRLRDHVEYVGHVHVADNPGRHEPGTGELAYDRVFEAIADLDYDGYVSGEFAPRADPEEAFASVREIADAARD